MGRKFIIRDEKNETLAVITFFFLLEIKNFVGMIIFPNLKRYEISFYSENNNMDEIVKGLIKKIGIEKYKDYIEI
ncbi:MAG: hypothetical protein WC223_10780 [Bacteroidales bacterium]|jgi:hypothetical protein